MIYPFQVVTAMEHWQVNKHQKLYIHPREGCSGPCAFHSPSDHHMVAWPLWWRDDRYPSLLERTCEHGYGHPDPDQITFWRRTMDHQEVGVLRVHGCDGCCGVPE